MDRIILHYDMDAFFTSIEQRDNPSLKGKKLVVGEGVVSTSSYEARKNGIKSGSPLYPILKQFKDVIVIHPRTEYYFREGRKIQEYLSEKLDVIEFTSCDEGYIDITDLILIKNINLDERLNKFIDRFQRAIFKKFFLTCSVGIGYNMLSAKLASDINKPCGRYIIHNEEEYVKYIINKPLGIIPGIGKSTIDILRSFEIYTPKDLFLFDEKNLLPIFNKNRIEYIKSLIKGTKQDIVHKKGISISKETTFISNQTSKDEIIKEYRRLSKYVFNKLNEKSPRTITLKIKYYNFSITTKSKTYTDGINTEDILNQEVVKLLDLIDISKPIRLIGLAVSNFTTKKESLTLF